MTQVTLNVEDISVLPKLRELIGGMKGVSIAKTPKSRRMSGIEESLEDVRQGRVTHYETVDDFFNAFGI